VPPLTVKREAGVRVRGECGPGTQPQGSFTCHAPALATCLRLPSAEPERAARSRVAWRAGLAAAVVLTLAAGPGTMPALGWLRRIGRPEGVSRGMMASPSAAG
jgi:hypothetical protein